MNLIPELRFPEFANNGKWDNKPISKLGETVNGLSGKKGADFGSGRPYVQYKQVFDKSFIDFTECGKVDVGENENQNQLQLGDILFTTSSETPDEVGFASVINKQPEEPTYLNSFCFILRPNDLNEINPGFSRYLFHSPIYRKSVSAIAQGSTRYNLSKKAFLKLRVPVPSTPEEQQKIASCLSSLDELIAAHNDKLDALKDHKKGLLQNLFPQEDETVPKVRFPEFEGDGEWVEKELSEVSTIITGSTPSTKVPEYYGGDIMFVSPADISNNKYVESTEKTLSLEGFEKTRKIKANSVMFVCIGSTIGKVAMNKFECATNQQINSLVPNNENSSDFLYSNLELNAFKISGIAGNQAVPIINKTLFSSVKLKFPPTKEEQQKIASCLSAVDELITAQQEKIEQLQQHKKGLMQGLFPKIES